MPPTKIAPNISISVDGISNGKNNDKLPHRLPSRQQQHHQQRKRSSPSPPSKRSRSFGSTTSSTSSSSVGTGTNKHKSSAPPPQHQQRKTHQPRPTTTATFTTATTKEDQHAQQLTIMDISNRGSTFEQTPKGEAQMVQMGRMGSQRLGIGNSTAAALGMGGSGRHFDDVFLDDQPIGRGGTLGTYHYKSNPHDGAGRRRTLCVGLLIFLVLFCAALGFHVAHKDDKKSEQGNLKGTTALPTTIEPTMTEEEYEQDMKEQSEALLQDLANEKEAIEGALANVRDEQRDPNNTPEEQEILDEKEDVLEDLENAYKQEEDVENFLTDDRVTDEMADLAEKDEELLENQQGHLQQEIDVLNVELNNADHGNNDVAETEELEEELGEIKAEEASLRDQEEAVEAEVDELIADFMEHTSPPAGDNSKNGNGEQTAAEVNQETEQGAQKEEDGQ